MTRRIIYYILLVLLVADIGYSFVQHLNQPLDGDMAGGIVPANDVKPILEDPLGISVLKGDTTYPNPNRFFSHWAFMEYFRSAPLFLQNFVDPVDSVYLSCAIAKIIIQVGLIFLLAYYISGTRKILKLEFLLAALLISPLFQTNGYRSYMGIIDPATTYTFFYALPCALLLLYFSPFIREHYHKNGSGTGWLIKILWIPLALVLCLSGPLNPGIILVMVVIAIPVKLKDSYYELRQRDGSASAWDAIRMIPGNYWFYLIPVTLFSFYSLYIGQFNSVNIDHKEPLSQLYSRLPQGILNQFTQKLGFPVLFAVLLINTIIIRRSYRTAGGQKILAAFKWIGIFAVIYILLLPLGGARDYRPNVLRYDTIMPVTLGLIFIFGASTLFLLQNMPGRSRRWYLPLIAIVLMVFTLADQPGLDKNNCEKQALEMISASKGDPIPLEYDCTVLSWNKKWEQRDAELNTGLLKTWKIIPGK